MSIKAFTDWMAINSRPKFNILTELNKLRKENKELTEEIKRLNSFIEDIRVGLVTGK